MVYSDNTQCAYSCRRNWMSLKPWNLHPLHARMWSQVQKGNLTRFFLSPVVRRTLLGTDGFSGFAAPAATNGGHQEALTSPSFCKAESIDISCVQIKIKPVELCHHWVSWQTELQGSVPLRHDSEYLIVFGENCYVCSNPVIPDETEHLMCPHQTWLLFTRESEDHFPTGSDLLCQILMVM